MWINNINNLFDHFLLDEFIDETILGQLRTGVNFNQTASAIPVNHDIVAEEFKAVGVVAHEWVGRHECFDDDVAHLRPDLRVEVQVLLVFDLGRHILQHDFVLIVYIVDTVFIDGSVGQMHMVFV